MEMPIEVVNAVAPSLLVKTPKPRKKYAKRGKLRTKVLNALGNGLRTTGSLVAIMVRSSPSFLRNRIRTIRWLFRKSRMLLARS